MRGSTIFFLLLGACLAQNVQAKSKFNRIWEMIQRMNGRGTPRSAVLPVDDEDGVAGSGASGSGPVHPCKSGTHNCPNHTICVEKPGADRDFLCQADCPLGFLSDLNGDCEDADECLLKDHNCYKNARCTNTDGSYKCHCRDGFQGNGYVFCWNVNECKKGTHQCVADAECRDTDGSYTCHCRAGFVGDGMGLCVDINECLYAGLHDCHGNATCENTPGNFTCKCAEGFSGDGRRECRDIDECRIAEPKEKSMQDLELTVDWEVTLDFYSTTKCNDMRETCHNLPGSFECRCKEGFTRYSNSGPCEDVNECSKEGHLCHQHADCRNMPGAYACICGSGYSGNGTYCEASADCHVSSWQPWTSCKFPCNKQMSRYRQRRILTLPSGGGKPCPSLMEEVKCQMVHCVLWYDYERADYPGQSLNSSTIPIYVHTGYQTGDCAVTRWSPWSSCSCAHHLQHRRRIRLRAPSPQRKPCPGMREKRNCLPPADKCLNQMFARQEH